MEFAIFADHPLGWGYSQERAYSIPQMVVCFATLRQQPFPISLLSTLAGGFLFHRALNGRFPQVTIEVDARLSNRDTLTFEKLSLQGGVRFADQDFSALAENTMPRDAFSGGSCRHCMSRGTRPAWQPQGLGEDSIG